MIQKSRGCVDLKISSRNIKTRKGRKDQILNDSRRDTVALRIATELLDGDVAGGGLANADLTTGRLLSSAPGFLGRTATSAAEAAACCRWFQRRKRTFNRFNKAGESA